MKSCPINVPFCQLTSQSLSPIPETISLLIPPYLESNEVINPFHEYVENHSKLYIDSQITALTDKFQADGQLNQLMTNLDITPVHKCSKELLNRNYPDGLCPFSDDESDDVSSGREAQNMNPFGSETDEEDTPNTQRKTNMQEKERIFSARAQTITDIHSFKANHQDQIKENELRICDSPPNPFTDQENKVPLVTLGTPKEMSFSPTFSPVPLPRKTKEFEFQTSSIEIIQARTPVPAPRTLITSPSTENFNSPIGIQDENYLFPRNPYTRPVPHKQLDVSPAFLDESMVKGFKKSASSCNRRPIPTRKAPLPPDLKVQGAHIKSKKSIVNILLQSPAEGGSVFYVSTPKISTETPKGSTESPKCTTGPVSPRHYKSEDGPYFGISDTSDRFPIQRRRPPLRPPPPPQYDPPPPPLP